MKKYKIEFTKKAEKIFLKINKNDKKLAVRIAIAIDELIFKPHIGVPLVGKLKGFWKLRVGTYRIIYFVENQKLIIYVIDIGHRRNIYK